MSSSDTRESLTTNAPYCMRASAVLRIAPFGIVSSEGRSCRAQLTVGIPGPCRSQTHFERRRGQRWAVWTWLAACMSERASAKNPRPRPSIESQWRKSTCKGTLCLSRDFEDRFLAYKSQVYISFTPQDGIPKLLSARRHSESSIRSPSLIVQLGIVSL